MDGDRLNWRRPNERTFLKSPLLLVQVLLLVLVVLNAMVIIQMAQKRIPPFPLWSRSRGKGRTDGLAFDYIRVRTTPFRVQQPFLLLSSLPAHLLIKGRAASEAESAADVRTEEFSAVATGQ